MSNIGESNTYGIKGLVNHAATCFFNSTVQVLLHTRPLTNFYLSGEYFDSIPDKGKIDPIVYSYIRLLNSYWANKSTDALSPLKLAQQCSQRFSMKWGQQHDATECFCRIMDTMMEDASAHNRGNGSNSDDGKEQGEWDKYLARYPSFVTTLMYGMDYSKIDQDCGHEIKRAQPFCYIPLTFVPDADPNMVQPLSQLIKRHYANEIVPYRCEKCPDASKQDVTKVTYNEQTPPILAFWLKRWSTGEKGQSSKINTHVEIPQSMYIVSEHCRGKKQVYQLYAIIHHSGGVGGGHYYAHCRHANGHWYQFDDANVSFLSNPPNHSSTAYAIFYERM
jgi:ubiquitin C-terminal hydrolase